MTVDIRTGEVVAHMSATSARRLTDEIRETLTVGYDKLVEAWHGRADVALGYESWDGYCAGEFSEARMLRPTVEQRREIVASMRAEGMTTRAIGSALGVGNKTVHRDLSSVSDDTDGPSTVTSLDGRQRPARRPEPDVVDAEVIEDEPALTDEPGRITKITGPSSVSSPGVRPEPPLRTAEDYRRENAEQSAASFGAAIVTLSGLPLPANREIQRGDWSLGSAACSPATHGYVTPHNFRAIASGLIALADEWGSDD